MGRDLAIDLGTANTIVYRQGEGIVFDEPTVVALHASVGSVVAIGEAAWDLIGGDSGNVVAVRPLREGTVTEFEMTQRYLGSVLRRVTPGRFPKPRVLICIPSESSEVEKRAVVEAVTSSGGKQVTLVEEALAAAIGAGLPIHEPIGDLVEPVDRDIVPRLVGEPGHDDAISVGITDGTDEDARSTRRRVDDERERFVDGQGLYGDPHERLVVGHGAHRSARDVVGWPRERPTRLPVRDGPRRPSRRAPVPRAPAGDGFLVRADQLGARASGGRRNGARRGPRP